jgi:hypothetical protein
VTESKILEMPSFMSSIGVKRFAGSTAKAIFKTCSLPPIFFELLHFKLSDVNVKFLLCCLFYSFLFYFFHHRIVTFPVHLIF